jgi:hypothetical protein
MFHPWTRAVTLLTTEILLGLFQEAVGLRPSDPAPESGQRIPDRIGRNFREALVRPRSGLASKRGEEMPRG